MCVSTPCAGPCSGSYKLDYRVDNAFDQWSGGKPSYETAVPVVVTAASTVTVTETVVPTGSLGGRLTNADGTPAAGVQVSANQPDNSGAWPSTTTDTTGGTASTSWCSATG